ncbi:MAG: hypothetical protein ACRCZ0_07830 [Cetobacterium sp.]
MKIVSFDVGEKNFAYSIILKTNDNELIIEKIAHHNILKKKMQTIIESCIIMTEILENIIKTLKNEVFSIIIEQQMRTNIRAQKLAQHLWSYFYLKFGMKDSAFCLKFVPSHLKTQYFLGKNKLDNRARKKWAVTKVHDILKKHNTEQNKFILSEIDALKKQDDVCDTILQSIAFLKI